MALHRFYWDSIDGPRIELEGTEARHLASVLRLGIGDKVELFDGIGTLATAIIIATGKNKATLRIENTRRTEPAKTRRVIIAASIAKGERFDWLIEKLTELGVERICPVIFERTVKLGANPKAVERWHNLAISAAKQCKRLFLPQIDPPMNSQDCIESIKKDSPNCRIMAGGMSSDCPSLAGQSFGPDDVVALIGPEGGFTEKEEAFLKSRDVQFVRLTDTVLRTETAALAFASVLCALRDIAVKPDKPGIH